MLVDLAAADLLVAFVVDLTQQLLSQFVDRRLHVARRLARAQRVSLHPDGRLRDVCSAAPACCSGGSEGLRTRRLQDLWREPVKTFAVAGGDRRATTTAGPGTCPLECRRRLRAC